jgi:hypothetical protein
LVAEGFPKKRELKPHFTDDSCSCAEVAEGFPKKRELKHKPWIIFTYIQYFTILKNGGIYGIIFHTTLTQIQGGKSCPWNPCPKIARN